MRVVADIATADTTIIYDSRAADLRPGRMRKTPFPNTTRLPKSSTVCMNHGAAEWSRC